jgi:xanthine dehydrogenase accessory factor
VEIYLEPVLPPPRLLLFGPSPVARALAQLGRTMGWLVEDRPITELGPDEVRTLASAPRDLFAVVATMGEDDEDAIAAALALRPAYVAVVASRKRFALVRETLLARGTPAEALAGVKNPAGLDIGASLPEELALSIAAEIVQLRSARAARDVREAADASAPEELARDPVCGMTVAVATARHRAEHDGRTYYFCNARCRERFVTAPARFLAQSAASAE